MTKLPFSSVTLFVTTLTLLSFILSSPSLTHALGSGSTLAIISATSTVCGLVSSQPTQSITCYRRTPMEGIITVQPNVSFSSISGGSTFFCGLRSGGYAFLCWDTRNLPFDSQRVYINNTVFLQNLSVGDDQVCAVVNDTLSVNKTGTVRCWRGDGNISNQSPSDGDKYKSISSGFGFSCGILMESNRIKCWGKDTIAREIERGFGDMEMLSLEVGGLHACGVNSSGLLVCRGDESLGQLNVPSNNVLEYSQLALGDNHSCAIRKNNGSVVCWGGDGEYNVNEIQGVFFESIVSGSNFTCGLVSLNFSVMCWGPGWPNGSGTQLPLGEVLPGPCVQSSCSECGFGLISRSSTIRRQSSRAMRRQRSGTSSKHADRAEEFSLAELAAVTNNFSLENKIGAGSFGVVYRGKLRDGREVAIKRGETGQKMKKFQEKESAFDSELGDDNGGTPTSIVDFAVPKIMVNELGKILDPRVGPPELNEAEAVELVGYTAMHCVNLEGKDRPTMTDIVGNLERALSLCDGSHGSISSGTISIISD
ncbi:hypothetical protein H0E87_019572 [Populus deltoides]|uniref:non-specific serine/threonine protein kinase n=1 Tax=Populus deltoides TaxID=3696 RepID=A0A8T2XVL2_POPDE|nr:hypothetical protein H0E87_019572 [Populus deltoides]